MDNPVGAAVEPVISPEPSPEEREALEVALARLLGPPPEPSSAWWRRGVEDDLGEDESA